MKILYISYGRYATGAGVHTNQFVSALKRLHPDAIAHTPMAHPSFSGGSGEKSRLSKLLQPVREVRALGAALLKYLPENLRLLKTVRPDAVVLREDRYISSLLLCRLMNIPVVLEVNALFNEQYLLPPEERFRGRVFWNWYERRVMSLPDHIMVVSGMLREHYISGGVSPDRISTNPNGVEVDRFHPGVDGLEVRRRLGLEDRVVVGFSGAVAPWHGLEFLTDMVARLFREHPEMKNRLRVLLVGKKDGYASLLPGLPEGTAVISGYVPHGDMPRYLAAMDMFVAPYPRIEPFYFSPLKVVEAMAMGLPVLASDQGQISELIRDGVDGRLYPAGDGDRFIEGLVELIDSPEKRRAWGASARVVIERGYTWENNARNVLEACRRLVMDRRRGGRPG